MIFMFEAKFKPLQLTEKDSLYPAQRNKSKFSDKNKKIKWFFWLFTQESVKKDVANENKIERNG